MEAVTRILRYLKVTPGKGLMFSKYDHTDVEGYTDADWAGSATDRHSTSGYFTFVGVNLVTWRSKKQKVVSRSSAEAEYRGMAHGVCELLWLRRLLRDLGFVIGPDPNSTLEFESDPVRVPHLANVGHKRPFYHFLLPLRFKISLRLLPKIRQSLPCNLSNPKNFHLLNKQISYTNCQKE
ncbi:hypothetical protein L3X38_032192 [Prunus dulcis]|uniref:BURP domain-containing protein n=1 Tax=Prunus dulcis TaxID=3755 RepID=A0AAD4VDM2_PRUDU|nr:hypothetical protein L3X38_032192 [Prunus dulcis]